MKIAYLGIKGLPSKSGTERVIEAIIRRLVGKHELTVYCDSDYTPEGTEVEGVRLVRIRTGKGKHLKPILLDILSAFHAILYGDYDIIHMNGVENCFMIPLLRLRFKVISTSHGAPGRMPLSKWNRLEHFLILLTEYPYIFTSNYITTISPVDVDYLQKKYRKKVIYIPNGVDINIPTNDDASLSEVYRIGLPPHKFIMFTAGRIIKRKGAHILLEALNIIKTDLPLLIVGDLEQVPEYGRQLKEMAGNNQVFFQPSIDERSLLFGILKLCRLFVFPSTAEGMSIMLLEAISLGIPIICSDILENTSVLGDTVTYFRSGDATDLAKKIQWAIANPQEMVRRGQSAMERVKKCYSWDVIAAKYDKLYQHCLQGMTVSDADLDLPST